MSDTAFQAIALAVLAFSSYVFGVCMEQNRQRKRELLKRTLQRRAMLWGSTIKPRSGKEPQLPMFPIDRRL